MPLQYTTDFNRFSVASWPEWPLVGPTCIHCNKSVLRAASFPTTSLPFLLSSLWCQVWCLCEQATVFKSWINFLMSGSACQESMILFNVLLSGMIGVIAWQSTASNLDKASAAQFSLPCLNSIVKSNSINFTSHFCWKVVVNLWLKIYCWLLWSVRIIKWVFNKYASTSELQRPLLTVPFHMWKGIVAAY